MAIKSPKCRFKARRDVIVVLNLEEKCLTSKGYVPLTSMPSEFTTEVSVLLMKE